MAAFDDDDAIEHTLCQIRTVHVFKIPPRTTSGGYRAADWNQEVWQGSLKIIEKRKEAAILLTDPKDGSLFAMCPVKEGSVERCVDSSRYFVFKIQNAQGRHAFIGVAFNEREEAFDFNVALQEYEKDKQRDEQIKSGTLVQDTGPSKDYSLKEGQKISIKLPPSASGDSVPKKRGAAPGGGGLLAPPPGSGGFLPPPPGSGGGMLAPPPGGARQTGGRASPAMPSSDPLGAFTSAPAATASASSGFGDFTSAGFAAPPQQQGFGSFDPLAPSKPPTNASASASPLDAWGPLNAALPATAARSSPPKPASSNSDPFTDFLS